MRIELTTFGTTIRRSNQLSYTRRQDIPFIYPSYFILSTFIFFASSLFKNKMRYLLKKNEIFRIL